jgi:hypothetical protein
MLDFPSVRGSTQVIERFMVGSLRMSASIKKVFEDIFI